MKLLASLLTSTAATVRIVVSKNIHITPPSLQSHITLAQSLWKEVIKPDDILIDCTCGNGYDLEFLATCLPQGKILALDKNENAIKNSQKRLLQQNHANDATSIHFFHQSHEKPPYSFDINPNSVRLIVFNLGYLPGPRKHNDFATSGENCGTTIAESTLKALFSWCLPSLMPGGFVSITVYPGHGQGEREHYALQEFARNLSPSTWRAIQHRPINHRPSAPYLLTIYRLFRPSPSIIHGPSFDIKQQKQVRHLEDEVVNNYLEKSYNAALEALRVYDEQQL